MENGFKGQKWRLETIEVVAAVVQTGDEDAWPWGISWGEEALSVRVRLEQYQALYWLAACCYNKIVEPGTL